jgi:glycosyltransferase involved in cell wall biosynthesis
MFSLCIPTMNRFDDFLIHNIPKYLENQHIDEIIISDENGKDIEKITKHFGEHHSKLKLFKNEHRLGPFMNKLRACSYAKNEWIALIDSDNFADEDYFITSKKYIETNIKQHEKNVILSPIPNIPDPNLHFSILAGHIYKKGNFPLCDYFEYTILMNTGNYIIHKSLIEHLDISNETTNIQNSPTCDVIFMNTLFFEQLDLNFHVVPKLEYTHVIHDLSIYKQLGEIYKDFNEMIRERHFRFICG